MTNALEMLIPALTRKQRELLIEYLRAVQRETADDEMLRAIVADNRVPVHPPQVGGKVRVDNAPQVKTLGDGSGWSTSPSIEDWRPPDERIFNQLMDAQDALDRAERAAKLKGTK